VLYIVCIDPEVQRSRSHGYEHCHGRMVAGEVCCCGRIQLLLAWDCTSYDCLGFCSYLNDTNQFGHFVQVTKNSWLYSTFNNIKFGFTTLCIMTTVLYNEDGRSGPVAPSSVNCTVSCLTDFTLLPLADDARELYLSGRRNRLTDG